jgi:DNA repair exonuclease SbcCD nuclease subunit
MILGIFGDTHYTNRGPSKRKDDFFATQLAKTTEALTIFDKYKVDYVLQSGDLFDTHSPANRVKAAVISILKEHGRKLYCIAGQHDISGHSLGTLPNSPLAVLAASGDIHLVGEEREVLRPVETRAKNEVHLYGASFGSKVPEPEFPDAYNILIIHAMIGDRELYPGQHLVKPQRFLAKYPKYNLVVAGDYHYSFKATWKDRTIVNAGCLVRKTVSKYDLEHKPGVVTFDTETSELIRHPLTITPSEEVFDLTKSATKSAFDIEGFIAGIREKLYGDDSKKYPKRTDKWKSYLPAVFAEKCTRQEVKDLIDDCLEKIES